MDQSKGQNIKKQQIWTVYQNTRYRVITQTADRHLTQTRSQARRGSHDVTWRHELVCNADILRKQFSQTSWTLQKKLKNEEIAPKYETSTWSAHPSYMGNAKYHVRHELKDMMRMWSKNVIRTSLFIFAWNIQFEEDGFTMNLHILQEIKTKLINSGHFPREDNNNCWKLCILPHVSTVPLFRSSVILAKDWESSMEN